MRFSGGAYHEVVIPQLEVWKKKVNEEFVLDDAKVKITECDEGLETTAKNVDVNFVAFVYNEKLVLHFYTTPQNIMVQGKCREKFVMNVLEPYFCKQIESNSDNINSFIFF